MTQRISVIVPNYNHASFLEKRIESILRQTRQDFELLLMDDASTDRSREILALYGKLPNVTLLFNEKNSGGPFKQWNRGVRQAKGDFIWIAESDDAAEPALLARLMEVLEKNPKVGLAYCQSLEISQSGEVGASRLSHTTDLHPELWKNDFIYDGPALCREYLGRRNVIPNASAVVFRKSVFEAAGGAEESYTIMGDWMTWVRMALRSDVGYVAEPLNRYRCHAATVRHSRQDGHAAFRERISIIREIAESLEMKGQPLERAIRSMFDRWALVRRDESLLARLRESVALQQALGPMWRPKYLLRLVR